MCLLILWLKRRRSGGHGSHQSPQETTSTAALQHCRGVPLGAPDSILWLTDARGSLEPAYYWWHLRNAEQELQEGPGERLSCDELFFKIWTALKGRHKEVCSSLRGGQIMLEDATKIKTSRDSFENLSDIYCMFWMFYKNPCWSKQEVKRSGHTDFLFSSSWICHKQSRNINHHKCSFKGNDDLGLWPRAGFFRWSRQIDLEKK